jgi:two-component system NarL family sensor kinase
MQGIDLMIENVGRISRDLSPSILENLGLSAAIKRLINDFVKNYDIRMAMDIEDIDNLYDQNIQIILYRIFQESLANIGKHSGAAHVTVTIRNNCNNTFFQLEDDGKGFDLNQVQGKNSTEKGMGLTAMHERARMVGATLDIWSQEGKGTRISLTVPTEKHNIDSRRV